MCRIIESIELLAIDINDMPWQVYDEVDWIKINVGILIKTKIGIPTKITRLLT